MPRQNRRGITGTPRPLAGSARRVESWNGLDHCVRTVRAQAALKRYRCPGCDQEIVPGRAHVVAWPAGDVAGDERRHWHSGCWSARDHRRPDQPRSRNAPRH